MEQQTYMSCVKINGIPILPPLMTDDIREEMNYYKRLAIAVESRLKSLQEAEETNQEQWSIDDETCLSSATQNNLVEELIDIPVNSEADSTPFDTAREATVINCQPPKEDKTVKKELSKQKSSKSSSDEESNFCKFNNSQSSDAVTASTDLNKYFNESTSTTKTTTGETTPEIWKPQVPKTLDIVPITLEDSHSSRSDKPSDLSRSSENTPKFVRQGSYVLDTPSPVLLAHLQTGDYIPSTSSLAKRRRSIEHGKMVWESPVKATATFVLDPRKANSRIRRNSTSNAVQKAQKLSRAKNAQHSTRSVDCIQTMLSREKFQDKSSRMNGLLKNDSLKGKSGKSISILGLADKLEGDLGSLNKTRKESPTASPEKVLHLFREIQQMQKMQMSELIEKQQREQEKMQEDFKKQQLLLLMQIKKVLPESLLPFENAVMKEQQNCMTNGDERKKCPTLKNVFAENGERMHEVVGGDERNDARSWIVPRQLFPLNSKTEKHHQAATVINAYAKGYLVRRLMTTERIITLKNIYKEALHCLLKLHVDAPLNLSELNFHRRLQLQCDAASSEIVNLFLQNPRDRMEIIAQDRDIKKSRSERPNSARSSYSFATQRTLARKKLKEGGESQTPLSSSRSYVVRARCQTWTSNTKEKRPSCSSISQGIKRSTSAGAVRKPWR